MQRRDFLALTAGAAFMSSIKSSFASSNKYEQKDVLMGKLKPILTGKNVRLREKAARQFELMVLAAKKDGLRLYSTSSYRDYNRQMKIWNEKYVKYEQEGLIGKAIINKIVEFSSIPGTSRHHWGTDCDLTDLNIWQPENTLDACHYEECGVYAVLGKWLIENVDRYGFVLAYNEDLNRTGFHAEPWHYSFADLSVPIYRNYINMIKPSDLMNPLLKGNEFLTIPFLEEYIHQYINGVNSILK
jgi:hypothetical protein